MSEKNITYRTFGIRVDAKGNYAFGPERTARSRRMAAEDRNSVSSEMQMNGKDRVYAAAVTYVGGEVYKRQTIPGALA